MIGRRAMRPAVWTAAGAAVALGVAFGVIASSGAGGEGRHALGRAVSEAGSFFSREEREAIAARLLAHPRVAARFPGGRVRVLRIALEDAKEAPGAAAPRRIAALSVLDETTGRAARFLTDADTGALLGESAIPGRPQPSEAERRQAAAIVEADPRFQRALEAGAVLEGGFAVDGPPGAPRSHRYLQAHLLAPDRRAFLLVLTVDLTARRVVRAEAR